MNDLLRFVGDKIPSHRSTNVFTNTSLATTNFFALGREGCVVKHASVDELVKAVAEIRTDIVTATGSNHVGRTSTITKVSINSMVLDLCKQKGYQ